MAILSMFQNSSAINTLRDEGYGDADFNILSSRIRYTDTDAMSHDIPKKKAFYRDDTGDMLGMHSDKYKPVSHKSMIDSARNVLERSELNLTGIKESINVDEIGTMCFVQHDIPNHSVTTPDGDYSSLQLLHINSTNGVWPYQASVGSLQGACLNKQVFLKGTAGIYRRRHTSSLDIDAGARMINNTVNILINQNEIWCEWANIKASQKFAMNIFAEASGCETAKKFLKDTKNSVREGIGELLDAVNDSRGRTNTSFMYLASKWRVYKNTLGHNYWAVYNTLTDWSTHFVDTNKNKVAADKNTKYIRRTENVRKALQYFPRQLAA